ncbi:MAG: right-handed parallel beta-helix repeat-containing protein [Candidatus Bathyarchaeota archaeon]|nr:MAG: right-handed parallel beta-helix repeat-containing protein [Candidatus Bathyarchaeota archaeon]
MLASVLVLLSIAMSLCVVGFLGLRIAYALPYTDINVETAYNMITNGSYPDLMILDVRRQEEYDAGHIIHAVLIPHTELAGRINELASHKNHEIIVYCRAGGRSATGSEILDSHNFTKVYNMLGGITAWQSAFYRVWTATVHNANTTINYDTIQAAIDAPETLNGHTIFVEAETYYEHVIIDKSISLIGEDRETTIINGSEIITPIVHITANNVTVRTFTIQDSGRIYGLEGGGIYITNSNRNNIIDNTIKNTQYGINLRNSTNNTIIDNTMIENDVGIQFLDDYSNNSVVFYNNLINNSWHQVQSYAVSNNTWDNGFEGNYWSNYTGQDLNADGICDNPYVIDMNNQDSHPLLGMFSEFNATSEFNVQTICNSTISDFQFNGTAISFNGSGESGTTGFCRICIPTALMNDAYKVFVNGTEVPYNLLPCSDSTHSYLYFTYNHSTQKVIIVPEFPTCTPALLLLVVPTGIIIIYKRRLLKTLDN